MSSAEKRKPKILLVYAALNHPLRANTRNLIECFRAYGDANWFYLNLAHKRAPAYVANVAFDLVIFQTTFTQRLSRSERHYAQMIRRAAVLAKLPAPKAALVQDEFWNAEKVERFINSFGIDAVFSVAPESEWPKIYPNVDRTKVRFKQVLTGYIDDRTLKRMIDIGEIGRARTRDIVYRAAGSPSPAWGRFGYLKQRLVEAVRAAGSGAGLNLDISTEARDAIYGDEWYAFLASARYTIGAESGSSLLDRNGEITRKVGAYMALHPTATFEDVEEQCFAGLDGNLKIAVIGPRHLEACATRTCQILIEGDYSGLLKPDIHYIPIAPDLSNLETVLASLGDEERRLKIAEKAFEDVVRTGKITYEAFVDLVIETSFEGRTRHWRGLSAAEGRILNRMARLERIEWATARWLSGPVRRVRDRVHALLGRA